MAIVDTLGRERAVCSMRRLLSVVRFVSAPRAVLKRLVEKYFPLPPESKRQQAQEKAVKKTVLKFCVPKTRIQAFVMPCYLS